MGSPVMFSAATVGRGCHADITTRPAAIEDVELAGGADLYCCVHPPEGGSRRRAGDQCEQRELGGIYGPGHPVLVEQPRAAPRSGAAPEIRVLLPPRPRAA